MYSESITLQCAYKKYYANIAILFKYKKTIEVLKFV